MGPNPVPPPPPPPSGKGGIPPQLAAVLKGISDAVVMTFKGLNQLVMVPLKGLTDVRLVLAERLRIKSDEDAEALHEALAAAADLTDPGELCGDRHSICGIALAVDGDDRVVDRRVCRAVEVALAKHLDDVSDRVFAEHHRAEHGLLSGNILRMRPDGSAIESFAEAGSSPASST